MVGHALGVPDGPGTGLTSPLVPHTVPQPPGVGLDRPAAGYTPRSESNHAKNQLDTVSWFVWSAMPLGVPDGPGTGLASPLVPHTVLQPPGVGLDRPAAGYTPRSESNHAKNQLDTAC